jgi:hypothetical protein
MPNSARARGHIRTPESRAREEVAQRLVLEVLKRAGFELRGTRHTHNRYLVDTTDASGRDRVFWFKLGWRPGGHGTSAVQITMLKKRGGKQPSEFPDSLVTRLVSEKFQRGRQAGVTDLLLFSVDNSSENPIAALLLPIEKAENAFQSCLAADRRLTRNGASPAFWLIGRDTHSLALASNLRRFISQDLLAINRLVEPIRSTTDDALDDLLPDAATLGNQAPERRTSIGAYFARDSRVREGALRRANGTCEYCGAAGFKIQDGRRYLECHHIQSLGNEGPDTPENVIALCANDHRRAHFGFDRETFAIELKTRLGNILGISP